MGEGGRERMRERDRQTEAKTERHRETETEKTRGEGGGGGGEREIEKGGRQGAKSFERHETADWLTLGFNVHAHHVGESKDRKAVSDKNNKKSRFVRRKKRGRGRKTGEKLG